MRDLSRRIAVSSATPGNARSSIEQLYHEHHQPLRRYLARLLEDPTMAEDVCHEAFVKALQHWDDCDQPANARGWLYRIATNTAYDHLRRQRHSWAYPPGNADWPTLPRYANHVVAWHARSLAGAMRPGTPWLDWALSYDTIGDPSASERDEQLLNRLLQSLWRCPDPPIVSITHYLGPGAAAFIGELARWQRVLP